VEGVITRQLESAYPVAGEADSVTVEPRDGFAGLNVAVPHVVLLEVKVTLPVASKTALTVTAPVPEGMMNEAVSADCGFANEKELSGSVSHRTKVYPLAGVALRFTLPPAATAVVLVTCAVPQLLLFLFTVTPRAAPKTGVTITLPEGIENVAGLLLRWVAS